MKRIALALSVLLFTSSVNSYTQSLADCKTVAALFSNTCTGTPTTAATWGSTFTGSTVTCSQTTCPTGYGTAPSCSWTRKLCVTCSTVNSVVYIRVQSNGLPDHCFSSPNTVDEQAIDFTVKFNPAASTMTTTTFSSQSTFDTTVCDPSKSSTVPTISSFTNNLASDSTAMNVETLAVVGINGVPVLSSASASLVDPFYPQSWSGSSTTTAESVDACLGHPNVNNIYHYHVLPPCLVNKANVATTSACASVTACSSDVATYALDNYSSYKTLKVLGLAKDGHLIYGPYQSSGTAFDCDDLDMCGGITLSSGDYAYIFTSTFPYSLNCFGKGETIKYYASCSTNTCSSSSVFLQASAFIATMTLAFLFGILA